MTRRTIFKAMLVGLLVLCFSTAFSQAADPLANQTTKCVLQYISGLSSSAANKVISGQWMNHRSTQTVSPQNEFDTAITSVYNNTSKWVGFIGTDYMREFSNPYTVNIKNLKPVNQPLINYFNQNGLVSVMVSFHNPWTGNNMNDLTGSNNIIDIVTSGHPANIAFVKQLDSVAVGLQQLRDSGVTVLFRPFHEMNGTWFWWGSKTATTPTSADFSTVWQFVFNYFTNTKNLHNLLWFFTPSARESSVMNPAFKTELFYYPGKGYVDIVGLDVYKDTLDIPNYQAIAAVGKPIGLAEFGPTKSGVTNNPFVYDYTILINQIKNKYPLLSFWLSWNHFSTNMGNTRVYYSLSTQNNVTNLLNDNWVVTRDEINYSNCMGLPVYISNFTGKKEGSKNLLAWTTQTEHSNRGFEVQRSANGITFNAQAFVNSKAINGNSSSSIHYFFTDEMPPASNVWYRLKQEDFDGKAKLSPLVLISSKPTQGFEVNLLYPNPANKNLNFLISSNNNDNISLTIINIIGKIVLQKSIDLVKGQNNFSVNLLPLSSGNYFLKMSSKKNGVSSTQKFEIKR